MLGDVKRNDRGFEYIDFEDSSGKPAELAVSSATDCKHPIGCSFVWIGRRDTEALVPAQRAVELGLEAPSPPVGRVKYPIPQGVLLPSRLHLNRVQVVALVQQLKAWLRTGSFEPGAKPRFLWRIRYVRAGLRHTEWVKTEKDAKRALRELKREGVEITSRRRISVSPGPHEEQAEG